MKMTLLHRETANELHAVLSPALRAKIAKYERIVTVPKGAKLLQHDVQPDRLAILNSGTVEIRLAGMRKSVAIDDVPAGKVFGIRAVVSGELPQVDVTCLETCQVTFLPSDVFLTLLKDNPEVYFAVAKVLAADLQIANSILRNCSRSSSSHFGPVKPRLAPHR
ncbi:MAG TPA: Crp/Fnr family transcriptional regulator [Candidatus Angelobacter sp.]|nr:Crp/Fnr family transcriptional regulator [Candidatus Angelobacter sp.]